MSAATRSAGVSRSARSARMDLQKRAAPDVGAALPGEAAESAALLGRLDFRADLLGHLLQLLHSLADAGAGSLVALVVELAEVVLHVGDAGLEAAETIGHGGDWDWVGRGGACEAQPRRDAVNIARRDMRVNKFD